MTRHILKFTAGPMAVLLGAAQKDNYGATLRYADEKGIGAGDRLSLELTSTGSVEGVADVTHTEMVPIRLAPAVIDAYDAEYGPSTPQEIIDSLSLHYDAPMYEDREIKAIILDPMMYDGAEVPSP